MTPKERHAKTIADLQNLVDIQSTPGNYNVDPYMHGYANGLILALHTARHAVESANGACPFLPAPAKWLDDKFNTAPDAEPVDGELLNNYDEEFLIGLWVADQRNSGAKTLDLDKVDTIREGIRFALELRTPA